MKLPTITATGKSGSITVEDAVFGAPINKQLLSQAMRVYIDHLHQGTSKVKTRSEVNMTKAKWFKQKGTGNARHGSKNAPIFVGGGVAHGPSGLRPAKLSLSQQMKQKALISALSAQHEALTIADSLEELNGKTKEAAQMLAQMNVDGHKVLIVLAEASEKIVRSLRNIENVLVVQARQLSAFDVAMANKILLTTKAVRHLEARLQGKQKVDTAKPKTTVKKKVTKKSSK